MKFHRYLGIVCALGLAGCTTTQPLPGDLPEQVEAWVADDEYGQALTMLDKVRSRHPRYIELIRMKPKVRTRAQDFAKRLSAEARRAWRAGDWQRAYKKLEYGQEHYPQSDRLAETREAFETERRAYLDELQHRLDLNTAPYLAENITIHRAMADAAPDHSAIVERTRRKEAELDAVYGRLVRCGMAAKQRRQWPLARRCLKLAADLKPDDAALGETLAELDARLANEAQRQANRLGAQSRRSLKQARAELSKDNVKQALQTYRQIDKADRDHSEVSAFKQELDARIEQSIAEGIEIGRKFYTQGKIERALAIWHALQGLDAHHEELNAHIARAEKVLSKIQRLRRDESVLPPQHGNGDG